MKKLILAPAVALAFTGLVAAPVAAAETPSTQSAEAKAEQIKKETAEQAKADKLAKEKKLAEEKAEQEKKEKAAAAEAAKKKAAEEEAQQKKEDAAEAAADKKKADAKKKADEKSGDDAKDSKKSAPKDEDSEDSKKDDSDAEDDDKSKDSEEPKDEVEKVDAQLKDVPSSISTEDLATKGVKVTVTGLEKGDKLTTSGLSAPATTASADGSKSLTLDYSGDADDLKEDKVPFTVTIDREGTESVTLDGNINVVDEVSEVDPKVTLSTDTISESDFNKDGITVTGTGFTPNGEVNINVGAGNSFFQNENVTADENGEITVPITAPEGGLAPGAYTVIATNLDTAEEATEQTFTVTEDAVEAIDASLKVDPKEITAADLSNKDKGVIVTVTGVKEGDKITDSLTGDTETATADGDYQLHLYYQGNPDSLEEGTVPFTVAIDREGTESETLKGNINIVAEDKEDADDGSDDGKDGDDSKDADTPEAPAEALFTVSPKTLEAADFANDKKGVTLAVEDCEPGADVHFAVTPKGIQVTAYENTVKADDEGKASVSVFGTSDNVSAYVGSYTASATCGDDTMKESFTVTAGADGGGDNGNGGGGNDGSELPRTGADLSGLATGAMLLLVGGAAIAMTGRRKKVGQSPSEF